MLILLRGISFRGFGADLMARAIQGHFDRAAPGTRLAIHLTGSYEQRAARRFRTLLPSGGFGRSAWVARLMPRSFREAYGLVHLSDVEAVLDAVGFGYSDVWFDLRSARATLNLFRRLKKFGRPIVLLPQAFGPFENPECRKFAREILSQADLIFARDPDSERHLAGLSLRAPIHLAPDFTGDVAGSLPESWRGAPPYACIAPNQRMLDKTQAATRERYVPLLMAVGRRLIERGLRVLVTTYRGCDDDALAKALVENFASKVEWIHTDDALFLKGILGRANLVVGSRYHFLVSALHHGVPAIGIGWSHKYEHLFADYGVPELLLSAQAEESALDGIISRALEEPSRAALRERLHAGAERVRQETKTMWAKVDRVLGLAAQ